MNILILFCIFHYGVGAIFHPEIQDIQMTNLDSSYQEKTDHLDVVTSLQQVHQTLSITDSIVNAIESSLTSFDDPIVLDDIHESYTNDKISYKVNIKGITISGLSDIVINDVSIRILPTRVVFDLTIPQLVFNVDSCAVVVIVHGVRIDIHISGQIIITNSKLRGTIGVRLLPPGVSSVNANLQIGTIKSTLVGTIAEVDIDPLLTLTIEHYIPLILDNLSGQINTAISAYILAVLQSQI